MTVSVFEYSDYKKFLEIRLSSLPKKGRGIKAKMAQHLGVNSTLISQIFSGEKDFTLEQAKKISDFLGLIDIEADYFLLLVQRDKAGTHDLKIYFSKKLDIIKKESLKLSARLNKDKGLTDLERSIFYSSKIYSSIHLYTSIGDGVSVDEITKRFNISRVRAMEVINFLISAGLISEKNGLYKMEARSTHVEKGSPFLINHHTNWRVTSIEKAEKILDEEMMYTGNFSLSKEDFLKIREELVGTLQKVIKRVQDSPAQEMANLNIDLYWI